LRTPTGAKTRRKHPAKGARAAALVASLAATTGVAGAMVLADGSSPLGASAAPAAPATPALTLDAAASPAGDPSASINCTPAALSFSGYDDYDYDYDYEDDDYDEYDEVDDYEDDDYEDDEGDYEDDDYEYDEGDYAPVPAPAGDCVAAEVPTAPVIPNAGASQPPGSTVVLGTAERTEWGNVQVQVTMVDGVISDIAAVQIPNGDRRSARLSAGAEPVLEADAIAGQDANLNIVSGATYTSRSYARSLQAALDQAAITAQSNTAPAAPGSGLGA
jgi:uncharacterized protein with FMN-binding domain